MSEPMSNIDSFWLHMDHPTNLMVTTGVLEFFESPDFDSLCTTIENRLMKFDCFKKRVVKPLFGNKFKK